MLAINNKKISKLYIGGKEVTSMYIAGQKIYKSGLKIVSFHDGTDAEISAMLDAHYSGQINISDYWKVGDTRVIHIDATNSGTKPHVAQNMTIVIYGFDHDNLSSRIGNREKAAVTVGFREALGFNGSNENEYYWGSSRSLVNNTDNYPDSPLRTWLNGSLLNAMPSTFSSLIKEVQKWNLAMHTDYIPLISLEKIWLLSYPEVFGQVIYTHYINGGSVGEWEGTQYDYMKTSSNRMKKANNNGAPGSSGAYYWLRSPSSRGDSYGGFFWCCVGTDGTAYSYGGTVTRGLAPAFCL